MKSILSYPDRGPSVSRAYPQYIGVLRPHIGHNLTCVQLESTTHVKCSDCNELLTGFHPHNHVFAFFNEHLGHRLSCKADGNEVNVVCDDTGVTLVESTPF